MSLRGFLRGTAKVLVGVAVVATLTPLASGDAEARRRGGKAARVHVVPVITSRPAVDAVAEESGAESNQADATTPLQAYAVQPVKAAPISKQKDIDVPGCTIGMICTVCLAGCYGDNNSIVHESRKEH